VPAEKPLQLNSEPVREPTLVAQIFEDPESCSNIVGLFDLLLKIDRRVNPKLYAPENKSGNTQKENG